LEKPRVTRPLREAHILAQASPMSTENKIEKWKIHFREENTGNMQNISRGMKTKDLTQRTQRAQRKQGNEKINFF
jgi:hypothetical protein